MGKVVPLSSRLLPAQVEAALLKAGDRFQRRLRAQQELPGLLASLVEAGQAEFALSILLQWGRGEADPADLLEVCAAAVERAGTRVP
ncbi:MAG: hypothetical protein DIU70_005250 [Bacillota bacterium]|nr:MAG: hypothetical protein DIU70_07790 [Bacillota bacterium]